MPSLRRLNRQTTPLSLAKAATATPVNDFRILSIVDMTGRSVGIVTQPDIHAALGDARARVAPYDYVAPYDSETDVPRFRR